MKIRKISLAIFCQSLMLGVLSVSFIACKPNTITSRQHDPVALVWRDKFIEAKIAAAAYRESLSSISGDNIEETNNRLLPRRIQDLSRFVTPGNEGVLKTLEEWVDFEKNIKVHYRTYDEIIDADIDINSITSGATPIISKDVTGEDGKFYRINLTLNGMVNIIEIK